MSVCFVVGLSISDTELEDVSSGSQGVVQAAALGAPFLVHAEGWPARRAYVDARAAGPPISLARFSAAAYGEHLFDTEGEGFVEEVLASDAAQDLKRKCLVGVVPQLQSKLLLLMYALRDPAETLRFKAAAARRIHLLTSRRITGRGQDQTGSYALTKRQSGRVLGSVYAWFERDPKGDRILRELVRNFESVVDSGWGRRLRLSLTLGHKKTAAKIFEARAWDLDVGALGVVLDVLEGTQVIHDVGTIPMVLRTCNANLSRGKGVRFERAVRTRDALARLAAERGPLVLTRLFVLLRPDAAQRAQLLLFAKHAEVRVRLALARFLAADQDPAGRETRLLMLQAARDRPALAGDSLESEVRDILENSDSRGRQLDSKRD